MSVKAPGSERLRLPLGAEYRYIEEPGGNCGACCGLDQPDSAQASQA